MIKALASGTIIDIDGVPHIVARHNPKASATSHFYLVNLETGLIPTFTREKISFLHLDAGSFNINRAVPGAKILGRATIEYT